MNKIPESIAKQPELKPAEDYYLLRREGIGFIEKMASNQWTDYNAHDPGITILEILCYAITDIAYRANWDIKDLLTLKTPATDASKHFPNQAFFPAGDILTVNPVTLDDFRRLLIDLDAVRNAWVFPLKELKLNGLYEVLVELETDSELGDLNDHKIEHSYTIFGDDNKPHSVILEMRFLDKDSEGDDKAKFKQLNNLTVTDLQNDWRNVFSVCLTTEAGNCIEATLRIFSDIAAKEAILRALDNETSQDLNTNIREVIKNDFFIKTYDEKRAKRKEALEEVKKNLHKHRNLCEDFCQIKIVDIEDIAVYADIEVTPDANIEYIQANIWFEIENYFSPRIHFYSLQELQNNDTPVETIFNGPKLSHGFIKDEELQASVQKKVLRTSDIINQLVDIDGVVAVNNLSLSKYDAQGELVKGQADKNISFFGSNKSSEAWELKLKDNHQPKLHRNLSRFLFFKNGLRVMPRMDEALQTLMQLRGEAKHRKINNAPIPIENLDLKIPSGTFRNPEDYYPLQYSFPLTYGIGREGLRSGASPERKAQAKQLKAYLMVFEQLLANALAQLANVEQLFSLDSSIDRTYFTKELSEKIIQGYDELLKEPNREKNPLELPPEFYDRRNRFLDHLIARFGEQFGGYSTNFQRKQVDSNRLIKDKISFLKAYPEVSSNRYQAFNYKEKPSSDNCSGLKKRVSLLLGSNDAIERAIIVEHLLLRPKFKDDALYPVNCVAEDPYSFRLTFVMPGWIAPYNTNLEMRHFAEQLIREETPAHILVKICWIDNKGFEFNPCDPLIDKIATLINPNKKYCRYAKKIFKTYHAVFKSWFSERKTNLYSKESWKTQIIAHFQESQTIKEFKKKHPLSDDIWKFIQSELITYFTDIALYGWQFERFEAVWFNWLDANAEIDCAEIGYEEQKKQVPDHLQVVIEQLNKLRNIYPHATLYDFDDGSVQNYIRLGKTALGSYPLRSPT
jgi:hypothetical protein